MEIITKHITLKEIEILREPLEGLHKYQNEKSKYFSGTYPRVTFEERVEEYREKGKSVSMGYKAIYT